MVPAFSSMSALLRIMPSIPISWLKVLACSVASFPVIDSPTNIFRFGFETLTIFCISFNKFEFVYILPAVSIRTALSLCFFAYWIASNATAAGSAPYVCFIIGTFRLLAWVSSCSIEAALNVSAAARHDDRLFCFR